MSKVILFNSIKGGVGKSTLAAQFAVYLCDFGKVAVMDCDAQQTLSKWAIRREDSNGKFQRKVSILSPDLADKYALKAFDFIIVDSAGVDSQIGREMLLNADYVVSPLQPSQADLDTIFDHDDIIRKAKAINTELKSFYLLNMCITHPKDKERLDSVEMLQSLERDKEICSNILDNAVFNRKILRTSFSEGGSCFEDKKNKAAEEVESVIKSILEV
ncbi:ParA family protein [Glaesserella parasuis]|uniref:ParA family protein n=2 Tax=Glaesserella parasuis TaxID=738 RepID=UPI00094FC4FC|nr:ParA family protein [Glaesserella parasuis]MCT8756568.1 ParA family protein [Glaesserella parasuis]MCT8760465.1 ParA family protein [Glaesserella parasuis]MCT8766597.1 ParA family protein [Glaesserella parasuis]MDD2170383.1 ParA family protein [Glaesserella parasuis]MDG6280392.1 ParA family protein [Glaesserella parasuis]